MFKAILYTLLFLLLAGCAYKITTAVSLPCEIDANEPDGLKCKIKFEPKVIFSENND